MRLHLSPVSRPRIKLTPLIDVIFLLVLFFLLASTFSRYAAIDLAGPGGGLITPNMRARFWSVSAPARTSM